MINLRYHIVSITAVFLALGIGVALGSTLIERATVDTLNDRLDEQSERLDRTDGENADLRDDLERVAEHEQRLTDEGVALYAGHLAEVPTVLLTAQGTDDDLVALTQRSLRAANADLYGTLRLTSRWESLSQDEVADLATLLDRALVRGPETRQATLEALVDELIAASAPSLEPAPGEETADPETTIVDDPSVTTTSTTITDETAGVLLETPILDGLIERGYVEFLADGSNRPLPSFGARYVLVVDEGSEVGVDDVIIPMVERFADADPAPLVVTEPLARPVDDAEAEAQPPLAGPVITAIRGDEDLAASVSSADSARDFEGQSATILALADLVGDQPRVGQYGIAVGATSLLPPIEE